MDVSGVDVDYLNDNEIFELFNQILDENKEEIEVLEKIDTSKFSKEDVETVYDSLLYNSQGIKLSDEEILDLNRNIVDEDNSEVTLINGHNIDTQTLSEEEILALYDDYMDLDTEFLAELALQIKSCQMYFGSASDGAGLDCTIVTYGQVLHLPLTCYSPSDGGSCTAFYYKSTVITSGSGCYLYTRYEYSVSALTYSSSIEITSNYCRSTRFEYVTYGSGKTQWTIK